MPKRLYNIRIEPAQLGLQGRDMRIKHFITMVLLFVICCSAWSPAGDLPVYDQNIFENDSKGITEETDHIINPEDTAAAPKETFGTSDDPNTSEKNSLTESPETIAAAEPVNLIGDLSDIDGWIVISVLAVIAVAGALSLAHREKKPKDMSKIILQTPETDPEKTVRIGNDGPYGCACCIGQGKRSYQEDSLWFSSQTSPDKPVCAIVADGMGGMDNGAESSAIARDYFKLHIQSTETDRDIPSRLWEISSSINDEVYRANSDKNLNGGTTLVCAYIVNNQFYWISIGDSRIYLYRDGMLAAVNEEHELETRLYELLLDGKLSLSELRSIPNRELRKLTSHVGRNGVPIIDQNYVPYKLHKGDKIVLCSDGVSGSLSEDEILLCLKDPDPEINCKCFKDLIEEKDLRGQDNYAAVVICCKTEDGK